jgi:hypothetical protein
MDLADAGAYAHFLPVIVELFSAIEAYDVSAAPGSLGQFGFTRWGERKGCSVVSATKDFIEQKTYHIAPLAPPSHF